MDATQRPAATQESDVAATHKHIVDVLIEERAEKLIHSRPMAALIARFYTRSCCTARLYAWQMLLLI